MKGNIFSNRDEIYNELVSSFPEKPIPLLSENIRGMDDPDIVHYFFSERKWTDIASGLNLKDDSYALELGVSFLPEDVFCYHIPLYIYASLHNTKEFWVFESVFIQNYLCPEYRTYEDFFSFIFKLSDVQLSVIARFMAYEAKILGFDYASRACHDFWDLYW
ncbi:hypothetical protein DT214_25680 [Salmonella enterica subsp. salamae]|nr:hypothetical protein [Salmonella enterica]EAY7468885.1 hypothetical protein [Salmonella enterica]EBN6690198.1 hypothetical protein [Salmonella enterica]ECI5144818.1 hypothetical protein [Salmonella enterica subsp. salamae]HAE4726149.1 hypothetical protein [Salmonella enterica subsp. salamae serovar 47:a:1,5]